MQFAVTLGIRPAEATHISAAQSLLSPVSRLELRVRHKRRCFERDALRPVAADVGGQGSPLHFALNRHADCVGVKQRFLS